jgi:hypothetical protein
MSQRILVPLLAAGLLLLGGWLLAQPAGPAREQAGATSGHFAVSPAGDTAVMLDTQSGKTWLLRQSADNIHMAWLPAERIDRPDQAQQWSDREKALRARLADLERQVRTENEKRNRADLEELEKQRRRLLDEGGGGVPKK